MADVPVTVPRITQAEMNSFYQQHFSKTATDHFGCNFLHPSETIKEQNVAGDGDEEEDGLGYYDDGAKRTLTDEQIAIFRHSELVALQRVQASKCTSAQQRKPKTWPLAPPSNPVNNDNGPLQAADAHEAATRLSEEGELPATDGPAKNPKKKKKTKRKPQQRAWLHPEGGEVVDLRKRTWDVVDKGLASLDYEDESPDQPAPPARVQRQQISYED